MSNARELLNRVKENIQTLLGQFRQLKQEKQMLEDKLQNSYIEKDKLNEQLNTLRQELEKQQLQISELNHRLEVLKKAESLTAEADMRSAQVKTKINELVKEIEKCIALLSHNK
jgi:chromosome segregation ATPase